MEPGTERFASMAPFQKVSTIWSIGALAMRSHAGPSGMVTGWPRVLPYQPQASWMSPAGQAPRAVRARVWADRIRPTTSRSSGAGHIGGLLTSSAGHAAGQRHDGLEPSPRDDALR